MCQAWRELLADERSAGEREGEMIGQEQSLLIVSYISKALRDGVQIKDTDIAEACQCTVEYAGKMREAFGV